MKQITRKRVKCNVTRNCPNCGNSISYTLMDNYNRAVKRNTVCRVCSCRGRTEIWNKHISDGLKNHIVSEETKDKIRETLKNQYKDDKIIEKYRIASLRHYKNNPQTKVKISSSLKAFYKTEQGKIEKEKSKERRLYIINKLGKKYSPNYNKSACKFFDNLNKLYGLNGVHAENGGEHTINKQYYVDYYEPTLNLIIEWQEPSHRYTVEKDAKRKNFIIDTLNCTFLEIREWNINKDSDYLHKELRKLIRYGYTKKTE